MDKDLPDPPPKELKKIPTVCGSLREALSNLDGPRLPQGRRRVQRRLHRQLHRAEDRRSVPLRNARIRRVRHVLFELSRPVQRCEGAAARPPLFVWRHGSARPERAYPSWTAPAIRIILRQRRHRAATGGAADEANLRQALARSSFAGRFVSAFATLAGLTLTANAYAADVNHGETLAKHWCAACHIVAPDQTHGQDNVPPFATIAKFPASTPTRSRAS